VCVPDVLGALAVWQQNIKKRKKEGRVEEDFTYQGHSTHKILPSFRALTNEAEQTLDLPRHGAARAKAPGCQRHSLLGKFEEEEEGIGVTSDVVKVQGEDLATPGSLRGERVRWYVSDPSRGCVLLGLPLRKQRDRTRFPNIRLIKTKQNAILCRLCTFVYVHMYVSVCVFNIAKVGGQFASSSVSVTKSLMVSPLHRPKPIRQTRHGGTLTRCSVAEDASNLGAGISPVMRARP